MQHLKLGRIYGMVQPREIIWDDLQSTVYSGVILAPFQAQDTSDTPCVIKAPSEGGSRASESRVKSFLQEKKFTQEAQDGRVVRYLEDFVEDGIPHIVLEKIEGSTCDYFTQYHGNSDEFSARLFDYTLSLAHTIEMLSSRGICHRDIKASNVLMDVNEKPRLIDFSISSKIGEELDKNMFLGTKGFLVPDLARERNVPANFDVYAVGQLALYLATQCAKNSPHVQQGTVRIGLNGNDREDDEAFLIYGCLSGQLRDYRLDVSTGFLPPQFTDALAKATQLNYRDRSSAADFVRDLEAIQYDIRLLYHR